MVPSLALELSSLTFLSFTLMFLRLALMFWALSWRLQASHGSKPSADVLSCQPLRKTFLLSRIQVSPSKLDFSWFRALLSPFRVSLFEPHISEPRSHYFESHFLSFTLLNFALSSRSLGLHSLSPHSIGSLHFFDPNPTPPDPRLRNIHSVTSVVRCVLKQSSRRTYKDNINDIKLGCKAIERRHSGPNNQDRASLIRWLRKL